MFTDVRCEGSPLENCWSSPGAGFPMDELNLSVCVLDAGSMAEDEIGLLLLLPGLGPFGNQTWLDNP